MTQLKDKSIGFKSLTENIDTTTPGGKLIFHEFGSLAEFERDLIRSEPRQASLLHEQEEDKAGGRNLS